MGLLGAISPRRFEGCGLLDGERRWSNTCDHRPQLRPLTKRLDGGAAVISKDIYIESRRDPDILSNAGRKISKHAI